MSTISATDLEVFKRLANPVIVDVQVESKTRRASAEMRQAMERAAAKIPEEPGSPAPSAGSGHRISAFRQAQAHAAVEATELLKERARKDAPEPSAQASHVPPMKQAPAAQTNEGERSRLKNPPREERPTGKDDSSASETEEENWSASRDAQEGGGRHNEENTHVEEKTREKRKAKRDWAHDSKGTRLEKQGYLIELANMRLHKGIQLSREFTMDDTLAELEFEIQKQNNNSTTRQHVVFMRDMMKMGINGLEIANARFGPFLSIDGWAESVTSDMTKYEPPLEKLYRRYFRSSQMSPIMELSWLLLGSMVAFHFKNKWFQAPTATQAPKTTASPRPNSSASKTRSARPVLRPPANLFGL